jgi:8-oxo-dGTP pyrophosphatase MutT (NUDIX family)
MGAGILPVALHRGTLYVLLGQERHKKAYNLWCDFGGTPNKGEKPYKTAIREGGEELNGFLGGNEKELEETVTNNMILSISYDKYTTYIFRTVFDPNLPMYFQNVNKFAETHCADKVNTDYNGLFEKKQIDWCPLKQSSNSNHNQSIEHLLKTNQIRPHYMELLKSVIKNEKFIKKEIRKLDQNQPKKNQLTPKQTQKKRKTRQRSNRRSLIKIKINNTLKARR